MGAGPQTSEWTNSRGSLLLVLESQKESFVYLASLQTSQLLQSKFAKLNIVFKKISEGCPTRLCQSFPKSPSFVIFKAKLIAIQKIKSIFKKTLTNLLLGV
jgi:hypothetical protein